VQKDRVAELEIEVERLRVESRDAKSQLQLVRDRPSGEDELRQRVLVFLLLD
jgi:hypothetical protein